MKDLTAPAPTKTIGSATMLLSSHVVKRSKKNTIRQANRILETAMFLNNFFFNPNHDRGKSTLIMTRRGAYALTTFLFSWAFSSNTVLCYGANMPLPLMIKVNFWEAKIQSFFALRTKGKHNRPKNRSLEGCQSALSAVIFFITNI